MPAFLRRFFAYLLLGPTLGAAAWALMCHAQLRPGLVDVLAALAISGAGIGGAVWLLSAPLREAGQGGFVVSQLQTAAADMTCAVAAGMAGFFVIDGLAARFAMAGACLTDPLVADVIAFMFVPTAAILALFVTQTGNQRVEVDNTGIRVSGAPGGGVVPWANITGFRTERQYVLVGRLGILLPRHLRTNLVIDYEHGESLTIFDPGTRNGRQALARLFLDSAPDTLRPEIERVTKGWG